MVEKKVYKKSKGQPKAVLAKGQKPAKTPAKAKREVKPRKHKAIGRAPKIMETPPQNRLWRLSHNGAPPLYSNSEELRTACVAYFEWVEKNPIIEEKVGFHEGQACRAKINKMRAMTIEGLSAFLGMSVRNWYVWKKKRDDLRDTIEWAEGIMREQKFTGAAAGVMNAHIITRDLGLTENVNTEVQYLDEEGQPTAPPSSSAATDEYLKHIRNAVRRANAKEDEAETDNDEEE